MKTSLLLHCYQPSPVSSAHSSPKMMLAAYPSPAHQQQQQQAQTTSPTAFIPHRGSLLAAATAHGFIPTAVPLAIPPSAVFGAAQQQQQAVTLRGAMGGGPQLLKQFNGVKLEQQAARGGRESPQSRSPSSTPPAPQATPKQHTLFSIDAILGKKDEPKKQAISEASLPQQSQHQHQQHTPLLTSPPSHTAHLTRTTANGLFYIYTAAASPTTTGGAPHHHPTVVPAAQTPSPFSPFAAGIRGHYDHHHHHHHDLQRSPLGPLVLPPPGK